MHVIYVSAGLSDCTPACSHQGYHALSLLYLSRALSHSHKQTHVLSNTLLSPSSCFSHTGNTTLCLCAYVLCALSISNTLERITCPTIVLCVLLVLLSVAVLLPLITTSTMNISSTSFRVQQLLCVRMAAHKQAQATQRGYR